MDSWEYPAGYYYALARSRWIWGRPAELWVRYRDMVAAFVKKAQPQLISPEHLGFDPQLGGARAEAALQVRIPPFPGGLRMPHLHLADKVYQLDQAQWKAFSGDLLKGFQEKLAHAGTVGVGELLELSDAVNGIG